MLATVELLRKNRDMVGVRVDKCVPMAILTFCYTSPKGKTSEKGPIYIDICDNGDNKILGRDNLELVMQLEAKIAEMFPEESKPQPAPERCAIDVGEERR